MIVTLRIDINDRQFDQLRFDIQTWLLMFARDECWISEIEDVDGFTLMTFDFRDALDAVDFPLWRDIRLYAQRT
jgi:hypothetical protein